MFAVGDIASTPTGVPGGSRLQASHIGTVAELCLRITSDILVIFCFLEKQLVLLRGTLVAQRNLSTSVTGAAQDHELTCGAYQEHADM